LNKKPYMINNSEENWSKLYKDIIKASKFMKRFKEKDIRTYIFTNIDIGRNLSLKIKPTMET
jgi:hypothetical protein